MKAIEPYEANVFKKKTYRRGLLF
uniref:Uncharacterized protein n=1 Tax=Rhizophora mucronata TaxID=61149 RepID=A0A2P2QLX5_RHIMU